MDTFEGVVEGAGNQVIALDATMHIGEKKVDEQSVRPSFVLRLDGGHALRVEGVEKAARRGRIVLKGAYGELLEAPLARAFRKRAPGDHVAVEIEGFALSVGDRVCVEGEVLEFASATTPGDEGGMREAPTRLPNVVRATRLTIEGNAPVESASNPDALPRATPRSVLRPLGTSTAVFAGLGVLLTFGSIVLMFRPLEPWRNWLSPAFSLGLVCLAVAIVRRLRAVHHAPYVSMVSGAAITRGNPVLGYRVDVPVFLGGSIIGGFLAFEPVSPYVVAPVAAFAALVPLLHALVMAIHEHAFRRFGRQVLFAAPASGQGRMARHEGRINAPANQVSREVSFPSDLEAAGYKHKNGNEVLVRTTVAEVATQGEPFELTTAEGDVRVLSKDAQVAFETRTWQHGLLPRYVETVGTEALVVGRREGDVIEVGGDESLFIWFGSRASLWRAWLMSYARPLGFVALSAALAWVAFHITPFAETWQVHGSAEGRSCEASVSRYFYGERSRCTVSLMCDGEALYGGMDMALNGGMDMGRMACGESQGLLSGADETPYDGDPALQMTISREGPGLLTWSTESRSVRVQTEPAQRSIVH